jgi:hypothetical protein
VKGGIFFRIVLAKLCSAFGSSLSVCLNLVPILFEVGPIILSFVEVRVVPEVPVVELLLLFLRLLAIFILIDVSFVLAVVSVILSILFLATIFLAGLLLLILLLTLSSLSPC